MCAMSMMFELSLATASGTWPRVHVRPDSTSSSRSSIRGEKYGSSRSRSACVTIAYMYSAVQINVVKGCVNRALVTKEHVYLDSIVEFLTRLPEHANARVPGQNQPPSDHVQAQGGPAGFYNEY